MLRRLGGRGRGGRGGGDAKTIISPNTSFGDIMRALNQNPRDKKINIYIYYKY